MKNKVNVLGVEYKIEYHKLEDDKNLGKADGYMDKTKKLVVVEKDFDSNLGNPNNYVENILRHELIHAFLYESGMSNCSFNADVAWAMNEEMVDWFAIQSPKIFKCFKELGIEK